jgi:uncharacterized repeat protein (TIGR01451 family)
MTASGGGGAIASGVLTVLNHPVVAKAFSPGSISVGGTSRLTISLSNSNASTNITGAAFIDTYPANLVNAATPNASTTCPGGTVTASAGSGTVSLSGGSIPAGSSCTVTVDVTSSTGGSYTNTLAAGSVSSTNAGSNTSGGSGLLTVTVSPSLVFLKTLATYSDPVNGTSSPKNIPGAEVDYTLMVTNTGAGTVDNNTLAVIDPIPANTELFVGNMSGGLPFVFNNSSSGLTCVAGCMDVSTDGGSNWIPLPGGTYAPTVTHVRFRPTGSMSATPASFSLQFRVRVK